MLFCGIAPTFAKQERDTPQSGETNNGIDDPTEKGTLSAEQPGNQVKLKNSNKPPVQASDNGKNQRQCIHKNTSVSDMGC